MKENMGCRLRLLMTIDDEETFLRKATDIMGKKAKEIAKNLLEIGLRLGCFNNRIIFRSH